MWPMPPKHNTTCIYVYTVDYTYTNTCILIYMYIYVHTYVARAWQKSLAGHWLCQHLHFSAHITACNTFQQRQRVQDFPDYAPQLSDIGLRRARNDEES